jgi:cytochrome c oxidase assembly factor CtaG
MTAGRTRRAAFLLGGAGVAAVALSPPMDAAADRALPAHMVQHMLLIGVVPPLLVLAEPVRAALEGLSAGGGRRLVRALRSRPARIALDPRTAIAAFAAVLVVSHLPAVYDAALRSELLHAIEHLSYLLAGFLIWSAILGADPTARPLSPVGAIGLPAAAMVPMLAVGVALSTASGVVYDPYGNGPAALADQQTAATIMWAGGVPFAAAIVACGWASLKREERRQLIRERAGQAGRGRL